MLFCTSQVHKTATPCTHSVITMSGTIRTPRKRLFPPDTFIYEEQTKYKPVAWPKLPVRADEAEDISFLFDLPLSSFMSEAVFKRTRASNGDQTYMDYIQDLAREAEKERGWGGESDHDEERGRDELREIKKVATSHAPVTRSMTRKLAHKHTRKTRSMTRTVATIKFA